MTPCQIRETNMAVRDQSNGLLGRLVLMGVDSTNAALKFAVLELDTVDKKGALIVIPRLALAARRVSDPDEIILGLSGERVRQAVDKFGFRWPDMVCRDWAEQLRHYLATHDVCACCTETNPDFSASQLN